MFFFLQERNDVRQSFSQKIITPKMGLIKRSKLKIEVSMHFEFPAWKVGLSVYEKEREDNERETSPGNN